MARPLLFFTLRKQNQLPIFLPNNIPISFFIIFITMISVFSVVSFLCASHHKTKKSHTSSSSSSQSPNDKRLLSKLNSNISSKALLMVKMVSWKKSMHEEEEGDDEAVWRKTIMMGERCRPLSFSGKIEYDCDGNVVPESSCRLHQSGRIVSSNFL